MKVVQIIQRYPPAVGGSEQWCREISQYLAARGDEVKVLTLDVLAEEDYWKEPSLAGLTRRVGTLDWDGRVQIRRYRRSLPRRTIRALEGLLERRLGLHLGGPHSLEMYGRLFREVRNADVVHLNTIPYSHNYVGLLAAKLFGKRVVITPHFHPGHPKHEMASNYWLIRRCDVALADSAYERDYLASRGVDPARLVVTGAGIHLRDYAPEDLERFQADVRAKHGLGPGTRILIFVGRKTGEKGLPTLVEALRLARAHRDVVLFLVGPSLDWFDAFYASLSEEDRRVVIDFGAVTHAAKVNLLHMADVLVLPSPFEAFGLVLLEAWACGRPVIGTEAQAVAELVEGGGLTFPAGDAPALAARIDTLLGDANLAADLARRGREKVIDRFQWTAVGAAVRRTYRPSAEGRLRILICTNLFPPHAVGGSEVVAYKQGTVLKELGHEVRVFAGRLDARRQRYRVKVEKGDFHTTWVSIIPEDLGGHVQPLVNPQIGRECARVLDEFKPDLVHCHNIGGLSLDVIAACRERAIPIVMTLHDYWGICFKNLMIKNDGRLCLRGGFDCLGCAEVLSGPVPLPSPVRNAHVLLALRSIDRFISPSRYLADRFAANGLPADRMHVIPNGIDLDGRSWPARRNGDGPFTIGYIGQLIKHKGVEILLRALAFVGAETRLIVAGDGDQAGFLRELVRELGVEERVTFTGLIANRDIAKIYEQVDVVVVPSIWPENSPVVITEAMAAGLPVVASDIGGIPELVEDGVTGFLVRPRDLRAMAARIEHLRLNPEARRQMGDKAAEHIKAHELRQQVAAVLEVYRDLVDLAPAERADESPDVILYHAAADWDFPVRDAIHEVAGLTGPVLLCRIDLAGADTVARARLLMIPSANEDSFRYACQALERGVPLIVHEAAAELKRLCVASNAGLFYATREELRACLDRVLTDASLRTSMGANGKAFVAGAADGALGEP